MKILISEEQLHFLLEQSEIEKKLAFEYRNFPKCVKDLVKSGDANLTKNKNIFTITDNEGRVFYANFRFAKNGKIAQYKCNFGRNGSSEIIEYGHNEGVNDFPACVRYNVQKGKFKITNQGGKKLVKYGENYLDGPFVIGSTNTPHYICPSPTSEKLTFLTGTQYDQISKLSNYQRILNGYEKIPTSASASATNAPVSSPAKPSSTTTATKPKLKYVATNKFPFKLGSYNANVIKNIQAKLGMKKPDGYFGYNTLKALKNKYNVDVITKELYDKLNPTNTEVPKTTEGPNINDPETYKPKYIPMDDNLTPPPPPQN